LQDKGKMYVFFEQEEAEDIKKKGFAQKQIGFFS